jgi:hypothetical protein
MDVVEEKGRKARREAAADIGEYEGADLSKPLDAIEAYLDKRGYPATRELIAKSLQDGGWGRDRVARPYWNLLSIMEYQFSPKLKSEPGLRELNGLVGRVEWPDDVFRQDEGVGDV